GDVELDVALQVAQERQRHGERDAELLLEQRIARLAAEIEVVQRHGAGSVVLALAEGRLAGEIEPAAPDAVWRVARRVRVELLELKLAAVDLAIAAGRAQRSGDDDLSLLGAGRRHAQLARREHRPAQPRDVYVERRQAAAVEGLHGSVGHGDLPIREPEGVDVELDPGRRG